MYILFQNQPFTTGESIKCIVKMNSRKLVIQFMHICDVTKPKMAATHSYQFSTIQTSVFNFLIFHPILLSFATDCIPEGT